MTALKKILDSLTDEMRGQECYNKYWKCLNEIKRDEELYHRLNDFRSKNVELHYKKKSLKEEAALEKEYHDLITNDKISEFLFWEQETLKMIRMIHKDVSNALKLDYDFL